MQVQNSKNDESKAMKDFIRTLEKKVQDYKEHNEIVKANEERIN